MRYTIDWTEGVSRLQYQAKNSVRHRAKSEEKQNRSAFSMVLGGIVASVLRQFRHPREPRKISDFAQFSGHSLILKTETCQAEQAF
jgi:hypothetical protein